MRRHQIETEGITIEELEAANVKIQAMDQTRLVEKAIES